MAAERDRVTDAVREDLRRLLRAWNGQCPFDRDQRDREAGGAGGSEGTLADRAWGALGVPVAALVYPLAVVGLLARSPARGVGRLGARLGVARAVALTAIAWSLLVLVAARSGFPGQGLLAVGAAGVVATVCAVLAMVFAREEGVGTTTLLAYPFGVTAVTAPPIVAAVYSPAVASVLVPGSFSDTLVGWLVRNAGVGGLEDYLRREFAFRGAAYVVMWFAFTAPLGWLLGGLVALGDVIRPADADGSE